MKFKKLIFIIVIAFTSLASSAAIVKVDTSVRCLVQDQTFEIKTFSFDLYATGFPMAGAGMYSGMFEAEAPGINCHKLRGHIYSGIQNGNFYYNANSNCLENLEFNVIVMTSFYSSNQSYEGKLEYREILPLGSSAYRSAPITCHLVQ
jgi:hypothetical protein